MRKISAEKYTENAVFCCLNGFVQQCIAVKESNLKYVFFIFVPQIKQAELENLGQRKKDQDDLKSRVKEDQMVTIKFTSSISLCSINSLYAIYPEKLEAQRKYGLL